MTGPRRSGRRRGLLLAWSFALAAILSTPVSGDPAAPAEPASNEAPATIELAQHVEHFGFYASAMGRWHFTAELAPYTTLTWIHIHGGDNPIDGARQIVERVRVARDNGVQAVLSLSPFLFADDRGTPRPDDRIEAFLVELRARLELEELLDTVVMLYPKDEPFREFRRARDPNLIDEYVTGSVYDDIHADLDRVLGHLDAVFPDKPTGVILSGYEMHHRFFRIPEGYDWVGFDCYTNLFKGCEDRSFVQLYGRLLAHMTPEQRLMAVPEVWAGEGALGRDDWPDILTQRLMHHWEIVMAEPRFVAVLPFLWNSDGPRKSADVGLDGFPETWDERSNGAGTAFRDAVLDLGLQVKTRTPTYPNLAWSDTESHPSRSEDGELGEIVEISPDGRVRVEALDFALPHKNLRVQLILRDAAGQSLFETTPDRTNLPVAIAIPDFPEDGLMPGTHGFEWQLPLPLLGGHAGRTLTVELLSYADGPGEHVAHRTTRTFQPLPVAEWPIRYDGPLFHPDLWSPTHDDPGPDPGTPGH